MSAEDVSLTSTTCLASLRLLIRTNPSAVGVKLHSWAVLLLQAYCWTAVPLAVAAARASRHLPLPAFTTVDQLVGRAAAAAGAASGVAARAGWTAVRIEAAVVAATKAAIQGPVILLGDGRRPPRGGRGNRSTSSPVPAGRRVVGGVKGGGGRGRSAGVLGEDTGEVPRLLGNARAGVRAAAGAGPVTVDRPEGQPGRTALLGIAENGAEVAPVSPVRRTAAAVKPRAPRTAGLRGSPVVIASPSTSGWPPRCTSRCAAGSRWPSCCRSRPGTCSPGD